jgi:hypothetical protein
VPHLVFAADRIHQRRLPRAIDGVDIGAVLQENIGDFAVSAVRREVQCSHTLEMPDTMKQLRTVQR